jgi:signal transduction histidine kinase
MVAGIVHDFRNLLTVLAIGADMLRRRVSDATLERVLDQIDAAVERGTALASKLLAFSRQQELDLEVVDVNQLVRALQPLMRSAAGCGERLQLDLASEVWPCRLDRTEFDRALLNLIVNARDAMPNGGEVRVATANASWRAGAGRAMLPRGEYVRVTVADDGQGMPPAVARRALEPFFTTKGESGTGLGLSQVYGFVRQVGGDLRIKSVPGAGTTVDLFFPRCAPLRSRPAAEVANRASHRRRLPATPEAGSSELAAAGQVGRCPLAVGHGP